MRRTVPSKRRAGRRGVRRSWLRERAALRRSAASASPPTPAGRIAAGVLAGCRPGRSRRREARPVAAADVERAVGAELERRRPSGSGYCWHQSSISTCSGPIIMSPLTRAGATRGRSRRNRRPSAPGGVGQVSRRAGVPSAAPCRRSRRRTCRGRRRTVSPGSSDRAPGRAGPVPVVVDLGAEVGEHGRRRVAEAVEDLDEAALLGDEDAAVGGELEVGRVRSVLKTFRRRSWRARAGAALPGSRAGGTCRQRWPRERGESHEGKCQHDGGRRSTPTQHRTALPSPLCPPLPDESRHHPAGDPGRGAVSPSEGHRSGQIRHWCVCAPATQHRWRGAGTRRGPTPSSQR